MTFVAPVAVAVWVRGRIVRSRGRMVTELQERTEELRTARERERARLEVARRPRSGSRSSSTACSSAAWPCWASWPTAATPPTRTPSTATLARIEAESRSTLEEMRAMVGVPRDDATDAEIAGRKPALTRVSLEGLLVPARRVPAPA